MIDQDLLKQAYANTLKPGIKPEDYFFVDPSYPFRVALIVAKEYNHLKKMKYWNSKLRTFKKFCIW